MIVFGCGVASTTIKSLSLILDNLLPPHYHSSNTTLDGGAVLKGS